MKAAIFALRLIDRQNEGSCGNSCGDMIVGQSACEKPMDCVIDELLLSGRGRRNERDFLTEDRKSQAKVGCFVEDDRYLYEMRGEVEVARSKGV